jgi:hypothetical protein
MTILSESYKNATNILQKFTSKKIKKNHTPLKFEKKFDKIREVRKRNMPPAVSAEFFKMIIK